MLEVLKALPLTFFSPAFYWDLLRKWRGVGIGFILALTLFDVAHSGILLFLPLQKMLSAVPDFVATLPVATVKNHQLSIDQPSPYKINFDMSKTSEKNRRSRR